MGGENVGTRTILWIHKVTRTLESKAVDRTNYLRTRRRREQLANMLDFEGVDLTGKTAIVTGASR